MNKRGLSPVIGYILLTAIIFTIVFTFFVSSSFALTKGEKRATDYRFRQNIQESISELKEGDDTSFHSDNTQLEKDTTKITILHVNGTEETVLYSENLSRLNFGRGYSFEAGVLFRTDGGVQRYQSPIVQRKNTLEVSLVDFKEEPSSAGGIVRINVNKTMEKHLSKSLTGGYIEIFIKSSNVEELKTLINKRTKLKTEIVSDNKLKATGVIKGESGHLQMPSEGNSIRIAPLSNHPLETATITIKPDDTDSANFNNLQWSLYSQQNNKELEIYLRKGDTIKGKDKCKKRYVDAYVYYENGTNYQSWYGENAFKMECYDNDNDGLKDEVKLPLNLTSNTELEYTDISKTSINGNPSGEFTEEATFEGHVEWEPKNYSKGDTEEIRKIVNHYLSEFDNETELTINDKSGNTVNEETSSLYIQYKSNNRAIKYVLLTEKLLEVNF